MIATKTLLWIGLVVVLQGCATRSSRNTNIQEDALFGTWHHAVEEDSDSTQVYYPPDHPLPPARFREQITFSESGELSLLQLAANDAHTPANGQWKWDKGNVIRLTLPDKSTQTWIVLSLTEDKLIIKK